MTLRVPRDGGGAVLTLPPHVTLAEGQGFAEAHEGWLRRATARQPGALQVSEGALVPVEGTPRRIRLAPVRIATLADEELLLPETRPPGPVAQAFLKHLAHQRLKASSDRHAAALGRGYASLVLRDTRSRWGSCTHDGRLMYSWRLAMAPAEVLDYVAAHEVAHLAHMDHSPRFWSAVERLLPGYEPHRAWLRRHGGDLLRWRFRD